MKIFTIGFTQCNAKEFFTKLKQPGLYRVLDSRLNNSSQLAGFTKKEDLKFFLNEICNLDYLHLPETAPTKEILDDYKKNGGSWEIYEKRFVALMESRQIEKTLEQAIFDGGCLLCSESKPHHCHRRLVAEYLKRRWKNVEIVHL